MLKRSPKVKSSYRHMSSTPLPDGRVFRLIDGWRCPNPDCNKVIRCDPTPTQDGGGYNLDCPGCGIRLISVE
jgi:hypothetical protein